MAKHVLIPMDRSASARAALAYALEEFDDAQLTVLHVVNPIEDATFTSEEDLYANLETLNEEAQARADEILDMAHQLASEHDRTITTESAHGHPVDAIIEFADDENVTNIIIGSHGRTGMSRVLLGSVAETVVRRASVPVTVIKD